MLMKTWQQEIHRQQSDLPQIPQSAKDIAKQGQHQSVIAVQEGIDHASEREAVFRRSKVERFALENHLGQQSFADLQQAIQESQELIQAEPLTDKYTTQTAIQRELETIRLMQAGKGKVAAIAESLEVARCLADVTTLTEGQQQAIEMSATSSDRILAWQGVAGSGKTYSLKLFTELATAKGYTVRGFAPSAEAAHGLARAANISSDTVASLLVHNAATQPRALAEKAIWIVDEARLLSAKDAHALLKRATAQKARVILVGDTRQLSAVEAGNPFKSLQAGGIQIAYLEESRRQKTQDLKKEIALLESGQIERAIQHLEQTGAVQAIPEQAQRFQKIAQDYMRLSAKEQSQTLLLAGTHAERLALTAKIRRALHNQGELEDDTYNLTSLRAKDLTTAQASYATYYERGDVLVPSQDYKSQGLVKYRQYRVVECDLEANRLTVETPHGQLLTVNPGRCQRKTVYAIQEIPIAKGDRLRWTRNNRAAKIRNGQRFMITEIDNGGNAQIVDDRGQTSQINLEGYQYIDYALVSTTYSSQGKTADRVLALMEGTTSQESFYVAVSRAKHHLSIYTADIAELPQKVQRSRAKENASDYIPLFQVVSSRAQTQKENNSKSNISSDCGDVRERIGDRTAEKLGATLWRDLQTETREHQTTRAVDQLNHSTSGNSNLIGKLEQADIGLARSPKTANLRSENRIVQLRQPGKSRDGVGILEPEFNQFEHQLDRRQQLIAATTKLLKRFESSDCLKKLLKKRHYQRLWVHYSQSIQAKNSQQLDYLVAHQAWIDGLEQKDIGLMLSAGSGYVQPIHEHSGKLSAVRYVNQTIRKITYQVSIRKMLKQQSQLEL